MFNVTLWPTIISVSAFCDVSDVSTVPIYFPWRKTLTRSDTAITSWSLCVMIINAFPSAFILRMTANRRSVSCGVRTAVGSSRIRISAPRYNSFTISTVCFSDTDIS